MLTASVTHIVDVWVPAGAALLIALGAVAGGAIAVYEYRLKARAQADEPMLARPRPM